VGDPEHGNGRYESIGTQAVSWHEQCPSTSLELLEAVGVTSAESVIDVGGAPRPSSITDSPGPINSPQRQPRRVAGVIGG